MDLQKSERLGKMRRQPQQARSQERVNRILDAAEALFIVGGYEAATTKEIASRAQIPIGTLYQFFPSKSAIAVALFTRYTQEIQQIFQQKHSQAALKLPLEVYINETVDIFYQFYIKHPGFLVVAMALRTLPEIQAVNNGHNRIILEELANFFVLYNPQLTPANSQLIAKIGVEVVSILQTLALMNPEEAPQIIAETKKVLLGYFKLYLIN